MRRMFQYIALALVALAAPVPGRDVRSGQNYKPFTISDLVSVRRVADPQISPDGRWVAYTIGDTDKAANKRTAQVYIISVEGGSPRQLTSGPLSATRRSGPPTFRAAS